MKREVHKRRKLEGKNEYIILKRTYRELRTAGKCPRRNLSEEQQHDDSSSLC